MTQQSSVDDLRVVRLGVHDMELARVVFALMEAVFEGPPASLSAPYLRGLLARPGFYALAAVRAGVPVGGITAHALPMTRDEGTELFIYDLAVGAEHQRQGIGRRLVEAACALAATEGIHVAFVPADVDDAHALAFYRALGAEESPVSLFTFDKEHTHE